MSTRDDGEALLALATRLLQAQEQQTIQCSELCNELYAVFGKERCQAIFAKAGGSATKFFMTRADLFSVTRLLNPPPFITLVSEWQIVPSKAKVKTDPLLGLEPEAQVLCFLYGLRLLFGTEERDMREWPQTKEQLQARAPSFCKHMASKLYKLSLVGVVIVSQGTHLTWTRDKVRQIVEATPQNIRLEAEALLRAAAPPPDAVLHMDQLQMDQSLGEYLFGPSSALARMHTLNVASVQDLIELVATHYSHSPLEAAPSDVRLAVRKGELFNWCRDHGGGVRISLTAAIEQGAVVCGGVPPHEWVGIPGPPHPDSTEVAPREIVASTASSDTRRGELDFAPQPQPTISSPAAAPSSEPASADPIVLTVTQPHAQESSSADPISRALQDLAMIRADSDRPSDTATRHAALGMLFVRNELIKAEERAEAAETRALVAEARVTHLKEELRKAQQFINSPYTSFERHGGPRALLGPPLLLLREKRGHVVCSVPSPTIFPVTLAPCSFSHHLPLTLHMDSHQSRSRVVCQRATRRVTWFSWVRPSATNARAGACRGLALPLCFRLTPRACAAAAWPRRPRGPRRSPRSSSRPRSRRGAPLAWRRAPGRCSAARRP